MWSVPDALPISAEQRRTLESWIGAPKTPPKVVLRARIVLQAAERRANRRIAQDLKTSRPTVILWRGRFAEGGTDALTEDAPGRGRKPAITAEKIRQILAATLQTNPEGATHWSVRSMAVAQKVSPATVQRIWKAHGLKFHHTVRKGVLVHALELGRVSGGPSITITQAGQAGKEGPRPPRDRSERRLVKGDPALGSGDRIVAEDDERAKRAQGNNEVRFDEHIWERAAGEPAGAYHAFRAYLELRNFLAAYRQVRRDRATAAGKTDADIRVAESRWRVPGAWQHWRRKWEWEKRLRAFDDWTGQQHRLEIEQVLRERRRRKREYDRMIYRRMLQLGDIIDGILAVPHSLGFAKTEYRYGKGNVVVIDRGKVFAAAMDGYLRLYSEYFSLLEPLWGNVPVRSAEKTLVHRIGR
jgi:transposase